MNANSILLYPDTHLDRGGPFDVIGDVHGCVSELRSLLGVLGYELNDPEAVRHPEGRTVVFLGDLVDRGPDSAGVVRLVMAAVASGAGLWVIGNHDDKIRRWLLGNDVQLGRGQRSTVEAFEAEPEAFRVEVLQFFSEAPHHLRLAGGALVVAHGGLPARLHGRDDEATRRHALYGEITGEKNADGFPVRGDWEARHDGATEVVFGHTPVDEPRWVNGCINIDTGCVFGGRLTALRWPERELVSVPAERVWYEHPG